MTRRAPSTRPFYSESRGRPDGFTLVELLVVLAVIAIVLSILLPAVQQARESARVAQCKNHLKQIALALHLHHDAQRHLPSAGWGWKWPPYPQHGSGEDQPGSWTFSALPYLEQSPLADESVDNVARLGQSLPVFHCPTRRAARLYFCSTTELIPPYVQFVGKSDYAANAGDHNEPNASGPSSPFIQPDTLAEGLDPNWWISQGNIRDASGLIFQRSSVRLGDVVDGTSNAYLVGEKNLEPQHYVTGEGIGDKESLFHGADDDTTRVTFFDDGPPQRDRNGYRSRTAFGGPHLGGCNFAFADGSVQTVSFAIDPETHRRLGNRKDGEITVVVWR